MSRKREAGRAGPALVGIPPAALAATADRKRPALPTDKSCPVGTLSELPKLMREMGHDPWELLESFGVTPALLAQPLTPIPIRIHGEIVQAAADAIGRDTIGLQLGQRATLENAGPLRLLVFNARTMREAIDSLVRYVGLWYRGLEFNFTRNDGFACFSIAAEEVFTGRNLLLTAYLAAAVRHLESILGRSWRPSQVHISYRRPNSAEAYTQFFRAPVIFEQPQHAIFFPEAMLDSSRPGSDRKFDAFLREYLGELDARLHPDFVARVRQVIGDLLASGECSAARVAQIFSIHRVTLHRYLREQGTTFEALLDDSRRDLAEQMLEHTDLPIGAIATALGYSAAGSFVRAFSRWHGATPGSWRKRAPRSALQGAGSDRA